MEAITYTAARQNLAKTMEKVCKDHVPVIITRKTSNSVVIMSLEIDFNIPFSLFGEIVCWPIGIGGSLQADSHIIVHTYHVYGGSVDYFASQRSTHEQSISSYFNISSYSLPLFLNFYAPLNLD